MTFSFIEYIIKIPLDQIISMQTLDGTINLQLRIARFFKLTQLSKLGNQFQFEDWISQLIDKAASEGSTIRIRTVCKYFHLVWVCKKFLITTDD